MRLWLHWAQTIEPQPQLDNIDFWGKPDNLFLAPGIDQLILRPQMHCQGLWFCRLQYRSARWHFLSIQQHIAQAENQFWPKKTFEVSWWGWECGCGLNITFRSQLATICKCWGNILFEISQINIYSVNFINITLQNINVKTFGSNSKLFWEFKVSPFDSKLYKSTRFVIQRAWKYLKIMSSFKKGMTRTIANNDFPEVKTFNVSFSMWTATIEDTFLQKE